MMSYLLVSLRNVQLLISESCSRVLVAYILLDSSDAHALVQQISDFSGSEAMTINLYFEIAPEEL